MAFCPKCKYEYETGVFVCPDCNEALVDELPREKSSAMVPDESWVPVGQVASQMKSEMAKGALDSNNIPSMILSSTFGAFGKGMDFHSGLAHSHAGGSVIMVPREFRHQAAIVLEAVLGEDLIQPENQP